MEKRQNDFMKNLQKLAGCLRVQDLLVKVLVADKKTFFKNERSGSKIGLLETSRIGLKLSDPGGFGRSLKIEKPLGLETDP